MIQPVAREDGRTVLPVSVVIPCYNAMRWIGATLDSVFSQDAAAREVVVVDDGSRDGTAEFVRSGWPQVRLVQQANAGVAAARNRGVREAGSEWVAFLDADDLWRPSKLRRQFDALAAAPDVRMAYSGWQVWASDDARPRRDAVLEPSPPGPSGWIYCDLLLDCAVWTSTIVMQRSLFLELNGFDEQLPIGEDYDLWLRASRLTPVLRIDEPLALYRQHAQSLTRRPAPRNWPAVVVTRAIARWGLEGPDGMRADADAVAAALAMSWRNYAFANLQSGNRSAAVRACLQALRLRWNDHRSWRLAARSLLGVCPRPTASSGEAT